MAAIPVEGIPLWHLSQHRLDRRLSNPCSLDSVSRIAWKRMLPGGGSWGRQGCRRFQFRSSVSKKESEPVMLKNSIEEVQKMRAGAIKDELTGLGISYADCFEKEELVVRLATARLNGSKRSTSRTYRPLTQLPITRLQNTSNSPKNYILIPLKINNQGPFNFILDTGSTVTLVQPSIVVDKLRLTPKPAKQSVALLGGGISNQKAMSITFSDVTLGNHTLHNISALLMDQNMLQGWDPSIAGLLGLNILSQFDVEFDFKRGTMLFHSPGAASRRECDVQGMEKLETSEITLGILGLKVALGQARPEIALLDFGSSLCIASPDVARLAGVPENVITTKNPALGGGGIGQLRAMQFSSGNIDTSMITADKMLADFTIRGAQFAIGEIPALRAVGCRILLGVNLFKNIRMIFSQSTKCVYMERPPM